MTSLRLIACVPLVAVVWAAPAGAQEKLKSGPQVGQFIPGAFAPLNVNGKFGKKVEDGKTTPGRHHCLLCDYELRPVVMIFARQPKDDKAFTDLLKRVDQAIDKDKAFTDTLASFVVFLSPAAVDSVTEAMLPEDKRTKDPKTLVDQSMARQALFKELDERAAQLKHVTVTCFPPDGPKGYDLNPKAEVTVVLYVNFKVRANFAFAEGELTPKAVDEVLAAVQQLVGKKAATAPK